jgi:hypothetical protein
LEKLPVIILHGVIEGQLRWTVLRIRFTVVPSGGRPAQAGYYEPRKLGLPRAVASL